MTRKSDFGGAYFVDLADPRITAETREEWRLRADAETIARVQQETADARQAARDELNAALGGETCAYGCGRPEAEPGAGYCSGFLSGKGPCTDDPVW